ncbi:hypothetical protein Misp01_22640 [Microtetraspora sp. NBRC 13810]|nr:hypothetical protein Misp01_22640 [Microtetraspora sp. NBRC 13810]
MIERVRAAAYRVPTDRPEGDGTLAWDATTLVVAHVTAGGVTGTGWTYAPPRRRPVTPPRRSPRW